MQAKTRRLLKIAAAVIIFQLLLLFLFSKLMIIKVDKSYSLICDLVTTPWNDKDTKFCGYLIGGGWYQEGLGNQMFKYASFFGMIQRMNANKTAFLRVRSDPSSLDLIFENLTIPRRLINESCIDLMNMTYLNEDTCCQYKNNDLENLKCDAKNYYVTGYRTSYKYFSHVDAEIRRQFTFNEEIRKRCNDLFNDTLTKNGLNSKVCTIVGAHLRRGDFLSNRSLEFGHWPAQVDYLKKVVQFYEVWYYNISSNYSYGINSGTRKGESCLVFMIFGIDYDWNLNATHELDLLRPNQTRILVMPYDQTYKWHAAVDMCALSLCDHSNIITTGTFSWWVGYFSRGMVAYQKEYARIDSKHYKEYNMNDYFKPKWVGL